VLSLSASDGMAHEIRGVIVKRCQDDDWPAAARRCLLETASLDAPKYCREHLDNAQNLQLTKALAAAELAERARTLPEVCVDFEKLVDAVGRCQDVPQDLRASLAQNLELARAEWTKLADKSTAAPACREAIQSIRQVVPAKCVP
jgi:hypothetical protein